MYTAEFLRAELQFEDTLDQFRVKFLQPVVQRYSAGLHDDSRWLSALLALQLSKQQLARGVFAWLDLWEFISTIEDGPNGHRLRYAPSVLQTVKVINQLAEAAVLEPFLEFVDSNLLELLNKSCQKCWNQSLHELVIDYRLIEQFSDDEQAG